VQDSNRQEFRWEEMEFVQKDLYIQKVDSRSTSVDYAPATVCSFRFPAYFQPMIKRGQTRIGETDARATIPHCAFLNACSLSAFITTPSLAVGKAKRLTFRQSNGQTPQRPMRGRARELT